jgi:hypothetical protein
MAVLGEAIVAEFTRNLGFLGVVAKDNELTE